MLHLTFAALTAALSTTPAALPASTPAATAAATQAATEARGLIEKKALTLAGARAVAAAAEAYAKSQDEGGAIAVVDAGGNLLLCVRLDGTFAAAPNISIGKARTSALFQKPTSVFETIIGKGRTAMTALDDFTPLMGGVPIVVDGEVVGAIGVSGAKSAQEDEAVAMAGAAAATRLSVAAGAAPVTYVARDAVAAAFRRGAPLFETGGYKVHASRRDGPGQAEVHLKDTDIVYVLEGTATVVTGGAVVEPVASGADEIRGRALDGGQAQRLVPGDVLVVPAGTPHWFRDVTGPFTYYVVKAS